MKTIYGVQVCLRFATGPLGRRKIRRLGCSSSVFWMQALGCGTDHTELKKDQLRAEWVCFQRFCSMVDRGCESV